MIPISTPRILSTITPPPASELFTYSSGSYDSWDGYPFDIYSTGHNILGAQDGTMYNELPMGGSGSISPDSYGPFMGLALALIWNDAKTSAFLMLCLDGATGYENFQLLGAQSFINGKLTIAANSFELVNGGIATDPNPKYPAFFWSFGVVNSTIVDGMIGEWLSNSEFTIVDLDA